MKYRTIYYIRGSGWDQGNYCLQNFILGRSDCQPYYNLGFRILKLIKK